MAFGFKKINIQKTAGLTLIALVRFLAGNVVFITLVLVGFVGASVLVWRNGISPVLSEDPDAASRLTRPVELRTDQLQLIISRRAERLNYPVRSFDQFNRLFAGTQPPAPVPSAVPSASPSPSPTPPPQ